jgi:hypothetical protein
MNNDLNEIKSDILLSLAGCYENLEQYDLIIGYCGTIIDLELVDD